MIEKRAFKGVWIPREVWLNKDLTLQEKVMLIEIDSLDNSFGCTANNRYFAEFFDLSLGRISQIITSLESKGFILATYTNQVTNEGRIIRVLDPFRKLKGALENAMPPLENDKHNNTLINKEREIGQAQKIEERIEEIKSNPLWIKQRQTFFSGLSDEEINLKLETFLTEYPKAKITTVFDYLAKQNKPKFKSFAQSEPTITKGKVIAGDGRGYRTAPIDYNNL